MTVSTLYICITCKKREGDEIIDANAGQKFFEKVVSRYDGKQAFVVRPVECLSNCKKASAVALTSPHKFSYILAYLGEEHVDDLIQLAKTYAEKDDGVLKKIHRPDSLKDKVQGRIPPFVKDSL